jgi:hypothetical protein
MTLFSLLSDSLISLCFVVTASAQVWPDSVLILADSSWFSTDSAQILTDSGLHQDHEELIQQQPR